MSSDRLAYRVLRMGAAILAFVVVIRLVFNLSLNNWVAGLALGSLYGVIAVGLVLIYRTNKIINFAAGALGAIPAVIASLLVVVHHQSYLVVLPIALIGGPLIGLLVDVVVIRRFAKSPRLILTVVTIGVAQSLAVPGFFIPIWLGARAGSIPNVITPWQNIKWNDAVGRPILTGNQIFALGVVIALAVGLGLFLRYTRVGIALRASAENSDRAYLLGIPVRRVGSVAWMLAGLLSALAVFASTPLVGVPSDTTLGFDTLLYALAAAVIARMEKMSVAVIAGMGVGVIIFGSVSTSGDSNLAAALMLLVILGALLVQRKVLSRAYETGISSWQAVREYRRIPTELRRRPEVVTARILVPVLLLGGLCALPFIVPPEQLPNLIILPLFGIAAVSLVVLTGWAGQISLGQFGIIGASAAVAGGLVANHNIDFFAALGVGIVVGVVAAVLIGLPAIRIQGLYLAVTTLAFGYAIHDYVLNVHYPIGKAIMPSGVRPHLLRPVVYGVIDLENNRSFYLACVVVLVLSMLGAYAFRRYRSGRVLIAARDNPPAASSYGISVTRSRMAAFAVSGAIAGLCGVMFAYSQHQVIRDTYAVPYSIVIFLAATVGGLNSIGYAVFGAMSFEALNVFGPNLYNRLGAGWGKAIPLLVVGPLLILNLYFNPRGLAEAGFQARDRFLRLVAKRRDILVPSLIADRRIVTADEGRDAIARAEHQIDAAGTFDVARPGRITCPVCGEALTLAAAADHPHLREGSENGAGEPLSRPVEAISK
jgi:branched-chain amino acid transport system permease protein